MLVGVGFGGGRGFRRSGGLRGQLLGGREFRIESSDLALGDLKVFGRGCVGGEVGLEGLDFAGAIGELLAELGDFGFESGGAVVGGVGMGGQGGLQLVALGGDGGELFAGGGEFGVELRDFVLGDGKIVRGGRSLGELLAKGFDFVGAGSELFAERNDFSFERRVTRVGGVGLLG